MKLLYFSNRNSLVVTNEFNHEINKDKNITSKIGIMVPKYLNFKAFENNDIFKIRTYFLIVIII